MSCGPINLHLVESMTICEDDYIVINGVPLSAAALSQLHWILTLQDISESKFCLMQGITDHSQLILEDKENTVALANSTYFALVADYYKLLHLFEPTEQCIDLKP